MALNLEATIDRMREASYALADGRHVLYDSGHDFHKDATDLYTVIPNELPNGSNNLENDQITGIITYLEQGYPLDAVQIGALKRLLVKYRGQVDALRAQPDEGGQDNQDVPDPGTARIVEEDQGGGPTV